MIDVGGPTCEHCRRDGFQKKGVWRTKPLSTTKKFWLLVMILHNSKYNSILSHRGRSSLELKGEGASVKLADGRGRSVGVAQYRSYNFGCARGETAPPSPLQFQIQLIFKLALRISLEFTTFNNERYVVLLLKFKYYIILFGASAAKPLAILLYYELAREVLPPKHIVL
jgi:hypothetical protein